MSIDIDAVKKRKEEIEMEIRKLDNYEKKYPKGEILCAKNESRYKWYLKEQGKVAYLPKRKRELAEALAVKKYFGYKKEELESELLACNAYLGNILSKQGKSERILEHPEYGQLIASHFVPMKEKLMEWQNSDYERCNKYTESLVIRGTQGKMLRSKSEAIIDRLLYQNKIPFRYEQKIVLNGITLYPDFVIRHPVTGEFYYWEHFGKMEDAEYINQACMKIKLYCENGIFPSINLLTTFETKEHPLSISKVERIIQEYFGTA